MCSLKKQQCFVQNYSPQCLRAVPPALPPMHPNYLKKKKKKYFLVPSSYFAPLPLCRFPPSLHQARLQLESWHRSAWPLLPVPPFSDFQSDGPAREQGEGDRLSPSPPLALSLTYCALIVCTGSVTYTKPAHNKKAATARTPQTSSSIRGR